MLNKYSRTAEGRNSAKLDTDFVRFSKHIIETSSHYTDPPYFSAWQAAAFAAIISTHELFSRIRAKMLNIHRGTNREQLIPAEWAPRPTFTSDDDIVYINICAFAFVRMKVSFLYWFISVSNFTILCRFLMQLLLKQG